MPPGRRARLPRRPFEHRLLLKYAARHRHINAAARIYDCRSQLTTISTKPQREQLSEGPDQIAAGLAPVTIVAPGISRLHLGCTDHRSRSRRRARRGSASSVTSPIKHHQCPGRYTIQYLIPAITPAPTRVPASRNSSTPASRCCRLQRAVDVVLTSARKPRASASRRRRRPADGDGDPPGRHRESCAENAVGRPQSVRPAIRPARRREDQHLLGLDGATRSATSTACPSVAAGRAE